MFGILESDCSYISKNECTGRNVILVRFLIQKHISKLQSSAHLEELFIQLLEESSGSIHIRIVGVP